MELLAFALAANEALAWPMVVIIIVVVLRAHIRRLIDEIAALKASVGGANIDVEFRRGVHDVARIADSLPAPEETEPEEPPPNPLPPFQTFLLPESQLDSLFKYTAFTYDSPTRILKAWDIVHQELVRLGHQGGESDDDTARVNRIAAANVLPFEFIFLFDGLRKPRNEAAHSEDGAISHDTGQQFIFTALRAIRYMKSHIGASH